MNRFPAASVGKQLGIGFGLLFLLVGVLGVAVFVWHTRSADAQRAFLERIVPLSEGVDQLERDTLHVAIDMHGFFVLPDDDYGARYRQARDRLVGSLRRFEGLPKDADGVALTRRIAEQLKAYIAEANRLVDRHRTEPVVPGEERQLSSLRERAMETMQRFADLQRGETAAALTAMQAARDQVSRGLAAAILLGGALSIVIAWVTSQSVRRPVNELVSVASSLEAGNWKPALSLSPEVQGEEPSGEMRLLARAIGAAAVALEQREQMLKAQNETLQAQNEEIQAQNEQLELQTEELSEADRRKDRFLGVLAHELRNPMAPISNSLALLKRAPPGSDVALRAQAMIERQARHLIRLIDDLLDVTRISQGKIRFQLEEVDLVQIVRACIEDQQTSLSNGERHITLSAPGVPVRLSGDRTRLAQVVGNLLGNAVKFTATGGRIAVSLQVDSETGEARLSVTDDGVGIEPALLPELFQPFVQGGSTLIKDHGGLGIGLSLVRSLVNLHGGAVRAHSSGPGSGAEFTVRLPLSG